MKPLRGNMDGGYRWVKVMGEVEVLHLGQKNPPTFQSVRHLPPDSMYSIIMVTIS